MANIKSAKKRIKVNETKRANNVPVKSVMKTTIKKALVNPSEETLKIVRTNIDKNNLEIDEKNNLFGLIGTLKEEDFKSLLIEAINPVGYNMIVTPKEIDFVIDRLANVISTGINNALHDKVTHLKV